MAFEKIAQIIQEKGYNVLYQPAMTCMNCYSFASRDNA